MSNLPRIPSELLEPHLSALFGIMVRELGIKKRPPGVQWFRTWDERFRGVAYLMHDMGCIHADIAFGSMRFPFCIAGQDKTAPFAIDPKRALAERRKIWECAREAVLDVEREDG